MRKRTGTYIEVISHILLWTLPTYLILRYDLIGFQGFSGKYLTVPLINRVIINILIVYLNIFFLFPALNRKNLTPVFYSLILIILISLMAFLKVKSDNQLMWYYFSKEASHQFGRFVMALVGKIGRAHV